MARHERSAGCVVIYVPPSDAPCKATEYLLLNYGRHWDFPKGHVEAGEDDLAAALRELREETGIANAKILPDFHHEITYFFRHKRDLVRKTVVFFLAQVTRREVTLSDEHVGYEFLPYEAALKRVTFASAKEVLRRANARLVPAESSGKPPSPAQYRDEMSSLFDP